MRDNARGTAMKCPHCQVAFHSAPSSYPLDADIEGYWGVQYERCPSCKKLIIQMVCGTDLSHPSGMPTVTDITKRYFARPKAASRPPPPAEVEKDFANDYMEASAVLADSPKASAALSRRCLQHILREKAGVKKSTLEKEIDEVLASKVLPAHLAGAIDAIRQLGNFAAHPIKSTASGEIVPVELGEAEWTLDVLDGLFNFYFVQPEQFKKNTAALNVKLKDAGKPPLK